jgi:hypothetical protein
MAAFKLLKDSEYGHVPAGTIVYRCTRYDYGGASDDTRLTGIEHVSMTLDPTGDYPFFTVPAPDLEPMPNTQETI